MKPEDMELRDYFALEFRRDMQDPHNMESTMPDDYKSERSYKMADAMLKAREGGEG